MGMKYIFEVEDETQLIVEIGVNSTGAAVITTKHPKYLTPYEEPDLDAIRNEAYEKGVQDTKQHWVDAPRSFAYKLGYENGLNAAWEELPPADVAPVVRCKDCKSRRIDGYCTKFQNNISGIAVSWFMPEDDGFCSYGERKGE